MVVDYLMNNYSNKFEFRGKQVLRNRVVITLMKVLYISVQNLQICKS